MELSIETKTQTLRFYCEQLTKSIDNKLPNFDDWVFLIKDSLTMMYKADHRKMFEQDEDLRVFLNNFGEFKKLIKE